MIFQIKNNDIYNEIKDIDETFVSSIDEKFISSIFCKYISNFF